MRETTVWALLYPSETLGTFAPTHALVGGRSRETARRLQSVEQSIAAFAMFDLLRADAEHIATAVTVDQAALIQGVSKGVAWCRRNLHRNDALCRWRLRRRHA